MTNENDIHDASLYLDLKQEVKDSQEKIFEELKSHTEDEMTKFKDILDEIHANSSRSTDQYNKLSQMMQATINEIKKVSADQKTLVSAIPNGLEGVGKHNSFHVAEEDRAVDKKILTLEIKKKIFSGIAWGIVVVVGIAIWEYIKSKIKMP
jgi:sugar-specific transcriptional regulator TrmB